jgi:plastocyanin
MNAVKHILVATTIATILVVGAISISSLNSSSSAYAEKEMQSLGSSMMASSAKGTALGTISSIQSDEKGQPAWIAAGGWKLFLMPSESNNTKAPDAKFNARFIMTKLDGTSKHEHAISDFVLINMSDDGNTTALTGNATMTIKDVPQKNIPITIKIMNHNIISIALDPSVNSHLGNTPLYGTVLRSSNGYHLMAHMEDNKMMTMTNNNNSQKDQEKSNEGHQAIDIVSGAASMGNKAFSPNPAVIKAGTEIIWRNADTSIHTVTSGKNSTPDNVFDSKILSPSKEFKFKFDKVGTYDYFCQLHPAMVGEITVN